MGRKRDRFWDYAEEQGSRFKCKFCKHVFPGGATRIKAHLAGVSGHDIVACVDVSQDVQKEAQETQKSNKKLESASTSSGAEKRKITSASTLKIKDKIVAQNEEEYMVEIILDDVVDRLVANVISIATENINFKWGFKDKEELKDLLYTLCKIQVVLHDAQGRQVSDNFVRIWLANLKDVVYEVDNVLDKFSYKTFRQKVQIQNQMMNQVPSFPFYNFDKVKTVKQKLDKYLNEVEGLCLKIVNSNPKIILDNIDSSLNDSEVIGSDYGIPNILDLLVDNDDVKLRFDSLPTPSLKRCFTYCAIFPKFYGIKKDELIQYWIAEGFLQAYEESMVMEDIGNKYFNILLDKSFLQNFERDENGNIFTYLMHNLVQNFVLTISKPKTLIWDNCHVRSLFVEFDAQRTQRILFKGDCLTKLCRLVLANADFGNILSEFKGLRVLKLDGYNAVELPESIGVLIHLRLLQISRTKIKKLPKSITELYNLQTLRIEQSFDIEELPEDLSNLINLRHICIDNRAPKNVGRLTCLQTLQNFYVGPDEGYRINELGALKNLRGEIKIRNLEKVGDEEEAKSAKLEEKVIFKLGLYWSCDKEKDRCDKDEKVLEGLKPHPSLKSLEIKNYGGKKFPSWFGLPLLYLNLIEITLYACSNCEEVPTLGQFPCLRVLQLQEMKKVRSIGSEFYSYSEGSYTAALFPALRRLELISMSSLEEWKDAKELTKVLVFPCLEKFHLYNCEKLRELPSGLQFCTSLQYMEINNCQSLSSLPGFPSHIQQLMIEDCGIKELPSGLQLCTSLQYMEINNCQSLSSFPGFPSHIQHLKIKDCGIKEIPSGLQLCTSLQYLKIEQCVNLKSISDLGELFHSLVALKISNPHYQRLKLLREVHLKTLVIEGFSEELDAFSILCCPSIRYSHASLKKLILHGTPTLNTLPDEIRFFTALENLLIKKFDGIKALPDWLGNLSSLQKLSLRHCSNLMYLPMFHLTKSKHLHIADCPSLEKRCAEWSGEEWFQISHIPNIKINGKYIQGENSEDSEDFDTTEGNFSDSEFVEFDDSEDFDDSGDDY